MEKDQREKKTHTYTHSIHKRTTTQTHARTLTPMYTPSTRARTISPHPSASDSAQRASRFAGLLRSSRRHAFSFFPLLEFLSRFTTAAFLFPALVLARIRPSGPATSCNTVVLRDVGVVRLIGARFTAIALDGTHGVSQRFDRHPFLDHRTMVWNTQEKRRKYWATRSSVRSFVRTTHSFARSGLLASLALSAALTRLLARSLCSLPRSWERGRPRHTASE